MIKAITVSEKKMYEWSRLLLTNKLSYNQLYIILHLLGDKYSKNWLSTHFQYYYDGVLGEPRAVEYLRNKRRG